jgi:murein DD-endopeptidase MepM/ murein hydrolase activator NlpD
VAFTPLREFIPGYADVNLRRNALDASLRADSISKELENKNAYMQNLLYILQGKTPPSTTSFPSDSTHKYDNISIKKSKSDSVLRAQIEAEDKYALAADDEKGQNKSISSFFFFTPLNGTVTSSFNSKNSHFGIDIAAGENEAIKATINGTVIFASWTNTEGYVIHIQHDNNLISAYKHNSVLLKKAGDYVKAGEVIAIIGNSGELSTGPHLHFELWYNGIPLNPQEYISF